MNDRCKLAKLLWLIFSLFICYCKLPIMILIHQMVSCPESHQMSIVGWSRDRDGPSAANISMAKLVSQNLKIIRNEVVVIP